MRRIGQVLPAMEEQKQASGFVLLIRLLATTGMRLSEVLSLRWPDIDASTPSAATQGCFSPSQRNCGDPKEMAPQNASGHDRADTRTALRQDRIAEANRIRRVGACRNLSMAPLRLNYRSVALFGTNLRTECE
jgi:hypothetical protein